MPTTLIIAYRLSVCIYIARGVSCLYLVAVGWLVPTSYMDQWCDSWSTYRDGLQRYQSINGTLKTTLPAGKIR